MNELGVRSVVKFLRSVAVLALDAQGQVEWLNSLGLPGRAALVDELAMEFDDGFKMLPVFVKNGWLADEVSAALIRIDQALSAISGPGNGAMWDVGALASSPRWQEVRGLARAALGAV